MLLKPLTNGMFYIMDFQRYLNDQHIMKRDTITVQHICRTKQMTNDSNRIERRKDNHVMFQMRMVSRHL